MSAAISLRQDRGWMLRLGRAERDNARNEAFNLVGEPFRWERLWKRVGAALDIEVAEPQPMSLATHMPDKAVQGQRLAKQNDLQVIAYPKLVNWFFSDVVFNIPWDMLSDMGKIRRAGFTEAVSTEDALVNAILSLKLKGILP